MSAGPRMADFRATRSSGTTAAGSSTSAGARAPTSRSAATAASPPTLNGDGRTDLYVTVGRRDVLLWNDGDGRFSDGDARPRESTPWGWHAGATVGDVNGDGRPDLFVAGYTDRERRRSPDRCTASPRTTSAVADRLYLNEGGGRRPRFREVAKQAGIESTDVEHGLGAVFTDVNRDGRLDLFVANDEDPNRLYLNDARPDDPAGLGFRLRDVSRAADVDDRTPGWASPRPTTPATGSATSSSRTRATSCTPPTGRLRRAARRVRRCPPGVRRGVRPGPGPAGARRGSTSTSTATSSSRSRTARSRSRTCGWTPSPSR